MDLSALLLNYTSYLLLALAIGYIADLIIGDPHGVWHPVCLIGNMISFFERVLRKIFHCEYRAEITDAEDRDEEEEAAQSAGRKSTDIARGQDVERYPFPVADYRKSTDTAREQEAAQERTLQGLGELVRELAAGICLVILVLLCSAALPTAILLVCYRIHRILGLAMQSYMSYTILATKSLRVESMKVYAALKTEGLQAGRQAVSMIVGRDTEALDETGVVKAAVETVAENTSDGVIAPLIFLVIGGPVLGYFYKAVNTMDSMVGYKNDRYRHFGTAAARLDDVLNFLPARISALLMIGVAFLLSLWENMVSGFRMDRRKEDGTGGRAGGDSRAAGQSSFRMNGKNAWKIWKRDRRNHASPNSAQTEAVAAGALGVQLAGDAWYFGVKHEKPTIGDALRPVEKEDIVRVNCLMYATSILTVVICVGIRSVIG
ncbi:MAG: cobalamin biosynthesis protein [Lachnospiraceae bacterium]|nr:cobalamin biosynthesis protein [Lachnospiraceae bacterium]